VDILARKKLTAEAWCEESHSPGVELGLVFQLDDFQMVLKNFSSLL
jgi:hypothetical protein